MRARCGRGLALAGGRLRADLSGRRPPDAAPAASPPPPRRSRRRRAAAPAPPRSPIPRRRPRRATQCGAPELQGLVGRPRTEIPVPLDPGRQRVACTTCPVTEDVDPGAAELLLRRPDRPDPADPLRLGGSGGLGDLQRPARAAARTRPSRPSRAGELRHRRLPRRGAQRRRGCRVAAGRRSGRRDRASTSKNGSSRPLTPSSMASCSGGVSEPIDVAAAGHGLDQRPGEHEGVGVVDVGGGEPQRRQHLVVRGLAHEVQPRRRRSPAPRSTTSRQVLPVRRAGRRRAAALSCAEHQHLGVGDLGHQPGQGAGEDVQARAAAPCGC